MNKYLIEAGIKIIGRYTGPDSPPVYWEYNGKRIIRPDHPKDAKRIVFEEFGIRLPDEA